MAIAWWPAATSRPAAVRAASSLMSTSATAAPSVANARAAAKPMPEPSPVTSATLFSKPMFIVRFLHLSFSLRKQQRLDRAPLIHCPVAFRHLGEGQSQVEDFAGVDFPLPH